MRLKCTTFCEMAKDIRKNNKSIILFGAGAIGTSTSIGILHEYGLCGNIACFVDSSERIWDTKANTAHGEYDIRSPKHLEEYDPERTVMLLTISRYADVIERLNKISCIQDMTCYFMPMMCIHNFHSQGNKGVIKKYSEPVIPKVIHYMWLGGNALPANLQKCVDSWKTYCPDYEIKCWNESNYDIAKHPYMKQAYENRAFGFIPDYARLELLLEHGGIYLDTDIELMRPLDDLLYQDGFCSVEKWQLLNFGGCSGAVKGNRFIKDLLEYRSTVSFLNADGTLNRNTCGYYDTYFAMKNGYKINGTNQNILDMTIYASDYFHPYDYMSGKCSITDNTFSIHHFNGGWLTKEQREANAMAAAAYDRLYSTALALDNG